MCQPKSGTRDRAGAALRKERIMKRKNRMSAAERKERRRKEEELHRIYEDEGFTEEEIMFMSKPARRALMEKYGMR